MGNSLKVYLQPQRSYLQPGRLYPQPESAHAYNNMGLLRVTLALLVIVSHSFELIGGRSSELLVRVFGTMTFGEVAVDGFFLLSGYLITKSYLHSRSIKSYLRRRILRIYPGYIVSYCLCLLIVAPLSGATPVTRSFLELAKRLVRLMLLEPPAVDGAFTGLLVPQLNVSMWTISYEFRCYLLVVVVGLLGLFRNKKALLGLVAVLAALQVAGFQLSIEYHLEELVGKPTNLLRLGFLFFAGSLFHVFANKIHYSRQRAVAAAILLAACMFLPRFAEAGFAIFGGYLLFWLAFHCRPTLYSRFDSRTDLSYGVYLYAYPVQNLLIYANRSISPWEVLAISAPAAVILAFASWSLVERPFMRLKQKIAV